MRAALVVNQAAQAATVAASPFSWAFQLVWLGSFACLPVLVAAACLPLAVLPVWDTLSAGRVRLFLLFCPVLQVLSKSPYSCRCIPLMQCMLQACMLAYHVIQ
jgi:hypothetical protein